MNQALRLYQLMPTHTAFDSSENWVGGRKKQIWFQGASNIAQGWHCRNTELHMMQGQWQYYPMALGRQGSGELFVELMIKFPLPWIMFTWFWLLLLVVLQQLKVGYCLLCLLSHNDKDEERNFTKDTRLISNAEGIESPIYNHFLMSQES